MENSRRTPGGKTFALVQEHEPHSGCKRSLYRLKVIIVFKATMLSEKLIGPAVHQDKLTVWAMAAFSFFRPMQRPAGVSAST